VCGAGAGGVSWVGVGRLEFAVFGALLVHPFEEGWFVGGGGGEEVFVLGGVIVVFVLEGYVLYEGIVHEQSFIFTTRRIQYHHLYQHQ